MARRRGRGSEKQPKTKRRLAGRSRKTPRSEPSASVDYRRWHPVWQVGVIDRNGPFSWSEIEAADGWSIWERLAAFETMTWHEIIGRDHHEIDVDLLEKSAQDRLREIGQDDVDSLCSLRIAGERRVWGILDRNVFKILWWDPNHTVYPVSKKNT